MVAAGFEAITDVNGHFAFAGLEPGPTTVTFDRRAYAPVSDTVGVNVRGSSPGDDEPACCSSPSCLRDDRRQ